MVLSGSGFFFHGVVVYLFVLLLYSLLGNG